MFSLLLLEKSGSIYEKKVKSLDKLYGLCNYRNEDGFEELYTWAKGTQCFVLFGKRKGKNNCENKCILPPPVQEVFYGNLCILKKTENGLESLTMEEWTKFLDTKEEETKPEEKELKKEEYEPEPNY
jgi:hypothetical protein